jgi:hypothetical protein
MPKETREIPDMPGTIREFKVYDETRHPPEWTSLVGAAACAVFMKDVETSTPLSRDGAVVLPKDCTFLRFDHFAEAREFCEAQVQRYPAMCCEIFDAQGKAKPPLLTVVHPSRAQKDGLSDRWLSRRTIAIVSILCAVPLFVWDWHEEGYLILPTIIGINLVSFALRLLYWNTARKDRDREQEQRLQEHLRREQEEAHKSDIQGVTARTQKCEGTQR